MKAQIKEISKELNLLKEKHAKLKKENEQAHILIEKMKKELKNPEIKNDSIQSVDLEEISIHQFNNLSLQSQQNHISQIKSNTKKKNQIFMLINDVLLHILKFAKSESTNFLRIISDNDNKNISNSSSTKFN